MGSEMCIRDSAYEPTQALTRMFEAIISPAAKDVFIFGFSPARLLWRNDFVIEKAFVYWRHRALQVARRG